MTGVLIGALFGAGLLVAVRAWRSNGPPPPLIEALQRVPAFAPEPAAGSAAAAVLRPLLDLGARLSGGRTAIAARLRVAGDRRDVEQYLLQQAMWAGAFSAVALFLVVASGNARAGSALVLVALAGVGGLLFSDYLLTRAGNRRREQTAAQFPAAAQLLALLLAAGEQPTEAIGKVGRALGGPLGDHLAAAAHRVALGQGFAASMREFAAATGIPLIERFVAGLLSALERGSPLSELMRAQALDAAAESHRQLMTTAGKRDIAMLVPVVFAVLPTVVVVVLLPGAVQLGLVGS